MAKKKRKRPGGGTPGRGSGTATTAKPSEQLPRVAPAEPGGPNRIARKEEARRQREAIQRKMARRRSYRVIGAVVAVILVALAITAYTLTRPDPLLSAHAGSVKKTAAYKSGDLTDRAHIPQTSRPKLSTYPTHPPASGPHDGVPLNSGVYDTPPDIYRAIHSLEHGAVIIWYRPGVTSSDLQKIKDFYGNQLNGDHVLVAPYSYPTEGAAGSLPAGMDMVLVAWRRYQAAQNINIALAKQFVGSYRTPLAVPRPAGYKGVAPEAGRALV